MVTPRRPAGAMLAGLLASALLLAAPGIALGAIDWTITRSPSSVMALTPADISLVATNIGSGGKKSAIGCIIVSIPTQFTLNSTVVTDASGHNWGVSFVNNGPATIVTVQAATDKDRLTAKKVESVSFKVNVTGLIPGAYQWTANAYNGHNCTGTFGQPTALTVTIGLLSINHPPVAVADSSTVAEDNALVAGAPGVLGNDIDIDGDPLTAHLVTGPVHGTLSLAADGSFVYSPFANFAGADSFTYRARDGVAYSASAIVSLTVTPVNDPPVAVGDTYSVNEGTSLAAPSPGVLANDYDVDSPLLTAQLVTPPAHGTLSLLASGSFTYTPYAGFSGSDTFQYRASDGSATSAPATVRLTVVPVAGTGSSSPTPSPSSSGASPGATPGATPGSFAGDSPAGSATPGPDSSPPVSPGPGQVTGTGGSGSSAPTPALTLARAPNEPIAPLSLDFAFAGMQFDWFIPGLAIGVPGLLVIAAIALQLFGALAWLPAVRRYLGGSDTRRRRRLA